MTTSNAQLIFQQQQQLTIDQLESENETLRAKLAASEKAAAEMRKIVEDLAQRVSLLDHSEQCLDSSHGECICGVDEAKRITKEMK